ncbi:MAG: glycine cleavage system protein R [Gammaproteobacteria bacterium]|nr:glycine cleavage system protein R [Gammaproteobacteria bacterium]
MMATLVLTVIGDDRLGIVEDLSRLVREADGNWLNANLGRLAGKFAGIIEVELPATAVAKLQQHLAMLTGLQISCHLGSSGGSDSSPPLQLRVTGNDRPGIVAEITAALRAGGANILQLESRRDSAPNWGSPLFVLDLTVAPNVDTSAVALIEQLEAVADDLMVDQLDTVH